MILKRIQLENIRSYENETIEFPLGTTLLSGGIGTGKTSILLGIEYALFGLQPGQRGAALLANSAQTGKVTLDVEIDGNEISIERGLKRKSKTITQDAAVITINGNRSASSVTEVKSKVLELLNYPLEFIKKTNALYRFTVYTPQEEMKQIIHESPENRLNILRHVFGIDKYKKIRENLATVTAKLREEARLLTVEIRDLEDTKNECESNKSLVKYRTNQIAERERMLEEKTGERRTKELELDEIRDKIREKEKFEQEVEKHTIMVKTKRSQLAKDSAYIEELEEVIAKTKERFDEGELRDVIAAIGRLRIEAEGLHKVFIDLSGRKQSLDMRREEDLEKKNRVFKIDICPTCLQDVSETHKHNILNDTESALTKVDREMKELDGELTRIRAESERIAMKREELEERKGKLELLRHRTREVDESKAKIEALKKSREGVVKDIEFLENHITFLKQSVLQYAKFTTMYELKDKERREAYDNEKGVEIEIAQLNKEVEMITQRIEELQRQIAASEKVRDRLHYIMDLEAWLSGEFSNLISYTERNIMMTVRQEFSRLFNKWFSMLTTDAFAVHLDEHFTPVIAQGDFELDYAYLSGGERTAVALAYRLALNQIIDTMVSQLRTRGLVILDEPTDGFSDAQLDKIRDIIQEINASQLLIVSHEQKMESFVDNIIRLKKDGGVSEKVE